MLQALDLCNAFGRCERIGTISNHARTLTAVDLSINEGTLVVTGGPGNAMHNAIVIKKTPKGLSAAGAELMLLTRRFGKRNEDWTLERQDLLRDGARVFDTYDVVLADGGRRSVWFDITEWLARVTSCT